MHLLKIRILDECPNKEYVREYYQSRVNKIGYSGDCGVDLIFPEDITFLTNKVTKCNLGISCEFVMFESANSTDFSPYRLVPRSSIVNTPLMLANSEGIIDPQYRGPLIAAFRCFIDRDHSMAISDFKFNAKKGDRLVQIVAPDLKPIKVILVDTLSETQRGSNGFGSTNKV